MIHRLITGDGVPYEPKSMEVRRSSLASLEDEEDEMLFATEIDTSSVRQLRGGNSKDLAESKRSLLTSSIIKPNIGVSSANASSSSASTLQDPIRSALATSSPAASTSSSPYSNAPSPVSTPYSATTATTAAATPIPSPKPNYRYRGSSEPASITIPAEKNSYEEDTEAEFMRNRELLVQKGVCSTTAGKTHRAHPFGKSNADSGIIFASALTSGTPSGSTTRAGRVFGEDEGDEMISSTTSHDEIRSMDIDIDADIDDINGSSEALFGDLDSLGVNIDDDDPFTFLDVGGNEVVESVCY
ncbi:hypothetical protein BZA70DRAFT_3425 [Myxozyma melibiosi]|uniref:Uncharacterized protein n=1 Tax=Myxozyma melibiosi TaxID=54550 RepID=A0ABR1FB50_9ASCO